MTINVEATYENGVLKPAQPLPLKEHDKVSITIRPVISVAKETGGMIPWSGDAETLERLIRDPEFRHIGVAMTVDDLQTGHAVY